MLTNHKVKKLEVTFKNKNVGLARTTGKCVDIINAPRGERLQSSARGANSIFHFITILALLINVGQRVRVSVSLFRMPSRGGRHLEFSQIYYID